MYICIVINNIMTPIKLMMNTLLKKDIVEWKIKV